MPVSTASGGDIDACAEIYRLNEPGRFPPGYFDHFYHWLRREDDLVLVCESGGAIRGFGGVSIARQAMGEFAALNFGMIHPTHHGEGYGTALLFARLAALPRPGSSWDALITTTGGSERFYRRFGFVPAGRFADEQGTEFDQYVARIHRWHWQTCRDALRSAPIESDIEGVVVPTIEPA